PKRKEAFFNTEVKRMDDGRVKVILSKQIYDRDGEILSIDGCDLTNFAKNPIMIWGHRMRGGDVEDVMGKWENLEKEVIGGVPVLTATPFFADHPKAQYCMRMVKAGILNTVSVGFLEKEYD